MCLKRSFRSEVWGGLSQLIALEAASSKGHNWTKVNEREAEMSLLQSARAVRENAYAPYSGFKVGAALRTQSGTVYTGVNVENAAYPEGTCAEAGAIAAMVAAGETRISEICVIADCPDPVPPCGGCRQRLAALQAPGTLEPPFSLLNERCSSVFADAEVLRLFEKRR